MQHRLKHTTSGRKARFSFPVLAGHEGSRAQRLIRLQSRPPPDDRAGVWLRPSPIRRGIFDVLPCNRGPGMRRHWSSFLFLATAAALLLAACSSGPVRRVSEPSASIQQLTVRADGSWSVDLRLQNYSSIPMRFGAISLDMKLGDHEAGTLQGNAGISIGRSEEHTSELQSLMRISYAVFCLKKK